MGRHLNEVNESARQRSGGGEKRTTEVTESAKVLRHIQKKKKGKKASVITVKQAKGQW